MATFNSIHTAENFGLRVCPYDANHKVKDSRFAQHLMKCRPNISLKALNTRVIAATNDIEKTVVTNIVSDIIDKVVSNGETLTNAATNQIQLPNDKCRIGYETMSNRNTRRTAHTSSSDDIDIDDDNWDTCAEDFSLFNGVSNADDEIDRLAEQFADIAVMARMTKTEKRKLNEKLVEIANAKKERKLEALKELIMFEDDSNAGNDGDKPFRQPKLSAKQVFKSVHNESRAQSSDSNTNANSIENENSCGEQPKDANCVVCKRVVVATNKWDNVAKQQPMHIYCNKCVGFAKGGYFECQTCKLEGFFAHKEIEQHMKMHFPHINIIHSSPNTVDDNRLVRENQLNSV